MNRRRRLAVPSRKLEEQVEVEDESSENISAKSPCSMEISNDVPTCNLPRFYGKCASEVDDFPATATHVSVLFDYELHYISDNPPLQFLEVLLLEHLATVLEFNDCRRTKQGTTSTLQVIGISADPLDRVVPESKLLYAT
jgi:hypothetical protein